MNFLHYNQPTKRHLISMLMRLARNLLVQQCLCAVCLEGNNNTIPIRAVVILQSPCSAYQLLEIVLASPNLIRYRTGGVDKDAHVSMHTRTSRIIRSAFEPRGFYYTRLENEAIKPMSVASAFSHCLLFTLHPPLQITTPDALQLVSPVNLSLWTRSLTVQSCQERSWDFDCPVHVCLVNLEKA